MVFYAHTGNNSDKTDWQPLPVHLNGVSDIAMMAGEKIGLGELTRLAGLLHDLGKYDPVFQKRLEGEAIRVDHSTAGALILHDRAQQGVEKFIAKIVGFAILGHHAGLPDYIGNDSSFERRLARYAKQREENKVQLDSSWEEEIPVTFGALDMALLSRLKHSQYPGIDLSFIIRMVFSCLVDADRRDTEAFCKERDGLKMERDWPSLQSLLPDFLDQYNAHMAAFRGRPGRLNQLRSEILDSVREKVANPRGFFTLNVPTGGGKTLASLGFALDHAKAHGMERIIYSIPYTSIIDQTAAIFKDLLGEENVLEHHSSFEVLERDEGETNNREKLKAAMEDWGAPVVVTTNVQLFESLYAFKTSPARKLKNIANSIIVLDEAQTVPLHLLAPCMRALDSLVRLFNCTIVFCTATQPALDEAHMTGDRKNAALPLAGKELAPDPARLAQELRRTTLRFADEVMDNRALVAALAQTQRGLVIVNSRRHAFDLYKECQNAGLEGLMHLTTRQCAVHRRKNLQIIRERLKAGEPCRVIATSLVEAGVDLDFPLVWRAEAGLDQVLQAAGRCNREGLRDADESIVTVFKASEDYKPPAEIRQLAADLQKVQSEHQGNLQSPAAIEDYFKKTYWRKSEKGLDREGIVDSLRDKSGLAFPFRSVGTQFCMIENTMEPVVIPYDDEARDIVRKIGVETVPPGYLARKLQSYTVQVPPKFRQKLIENGHVQFHAPYLRGDQFAVLETESLYKDDVGLVWEDADYLGDDSWLV
ncbi:MAG: CRISPR-associated helicase Cas3 [Candidatus Tokpelaia hoelldobleri]|uniref:CRISPR-associated helicase Cas3 n=1 Tax=Candidatus Tokpelaia hoelldobleri TaxID=1902579 RepID=A0A1U9JTV5_9HYPH|nr:MAG: CRISPR-associated helicase Cas3 [Candidatus Tokpelaia hoelldoblerii]